MLQPGLRQPHIQAVNFLDKPGETGSFLSSHPCQEPAPPSSLLNHLHGRRIVPVAVRFHYNLDNLTERHQGAQRAFNGELAKPAAQHPRYIGLADSQQVSGFHLLEAASLQDRVKLTH